MAGDEVCFYDTSLRDGLRNSGVDLTIDERIAVAVGLEAGGVHAIEIGFGGPHQPPIMQAIASALSEPVVYGLSRVNLRDLDRALEGVRPASRPGVNIYLPCSDQFLAAAGLSHEQGVTRLARAIRHARDHVDHVMFGTQDASRADRLFLTDLCDAATDAGATTISISDTVSHALPNEFAELCAALRSGPRGDAVVWSAHCHNELGLAVANVLAAVAAGARQVEGTLNGIGEGAGNTPLQTAAQAISARPDAFKHLTVSLDTTRLTAVADLLTSFGRTGNHR